jgi:MSHA biogenesis protein MshI
MKWPWHTTAPGSARLAIRYSEDQFAWILANAAGQPQRAGLESRGAASAAEFARRIHALGLPTADVTSVLDLGDAQLLQIEAPAVKPEELKSAARWRIKDLVDARLDELTIDVLTVGDGRNRATPGQIFVAAARNAQIQALSRRAQAAGLQLTVIDIAELAQRNLLAAATVAQGLGERATAALMRHGSQALLTICAAGELFYARRLDWDDAGLPALLPTPAAAAASMVNLDFVDYGAADAQPDAAGAPRLVVEVQRSMDLWERSWPDLPVAALWVQAADAGDALVAALEPALGFPVHRLDPERLFPGFDAVATTPELRSAALPLLSALRRHLA